ncbi:MAG TPA: Maf family protein [Chloroflexota bacterium]|nr:Maf family protein [Chloroflexota bacterium]HUM72376.1 Maf family protein [Chloroflexota bacterium]
MSDDKGIVYLLASQSPRRRELMKLLGHPVSQVAADVDEDSVNTPDPAANVMDTAVLKAHTIAHTFTSAPGLRTILIAADTTVAVDGEMLNKPADETEARWMLRRLRGRAHEVHSGYVVRELGSGAEVVGVHTAVVTMRPYTDAEIEAYVATGDPLDKAGAYAIQHPVFRPVQSLQGCFLGVMGLPLCDLMGALRELGVEVNVDLTAVHLAHQQFPCPVIDHLIGRLVLRQSDVQSP